MFEDTKSRERGRENGKKRNTNLNVHCPRTPFSQENNAFLVLFPLPKWHLQNMLTVFRRQQKCYYLRLRLLRVTDRVRSFIPPSFPPFVHPSVRLSCLSVCPSLLLFCLSDWCFIPPLHDFVRVEGLSNVCKTNASRARASFILSGSVS